jgi:hypothetical protein
MVTFATINKLIRITGSDVRYGPAIKNAALNDRQPLKMKSCGRAVTFAAGAISLYISDHISERAKLSPLKSNTLSAANAL